MTTFDDRSLRLVAKCRAAFTQGNITSAKLALNKLVRQHPNAVQTNLLAAQLHMLEGDFKAGTELFTQLSQNHEIDDAEVQQLADLLKHYELHFAYFELMARNTDAQEAAQQFQLALAAMQIGRIEQALELFECSHALASDHPDWYLHCGHAHKAMANTAAASDCYQQFIQHQPSAAGVGYWSLADLKNYHFTPADEANIRQFLLEAETPKQRALLEFAQHRIAEQQKNMPEAVQALEQANQSIAQVRPFNQNGYKQLVTQLLDWQPHLVDTALSNHPAPIFIVGLPRSGTTLTEQILASHPQITTSDELPFIERIAMQVAAGRNYPAAVDALSTQQRGELANYYQWQAAQYAPEFSGQIIDKNPNNLLHIGLILSLFPNAKVISLLRPVNDNAVSLLRQHFSRGNDYAYSPESIVNYLTGIYQLSTHWKQQFGQRIYHLDYAKLVTEPELTIKALLDYCELPFDERCLNFHEQQSPVLTPSASQVRQPISAKTLGKSEPYLPLFAKFRAELEALEQARLALVGTV